MVIILLNRRGRWEVRQRPDELPKSFVLCLLTGLVLQTQAGKIIEPDISEQDFKLHWVRDENLWTISFGIGDVPLRGAIKKGWCVLVAESFLVELPLPEGCTLGPPAVRERAVLKNQWQRLLDPPV